MRLRRLRRPKTAHEKRANQDGWNRPGRNAHNLPSAWDDVWRPVQRSWKKFRKKQYKND